MIYLRLYFNKQVGLKRNLQQTVDFIITSEIEPKQMIANQLKFFNLQKSISLQGKLCIKFFATQNQRNKDSNWIYSSKYDEMKSMYKGKIFVTTDTGNDSHDVTLRMYNALMKESTVVFSHNPYHTNMLLKALAHKDRYVDPSLHKSSENQTIIDKNQIIPKDNQSSSLVKTDLKKQQQKTFQQSIEMGKYVDMEIDLESVLKKNNDPGNKNLYQRQKELKKYLKNRQFRTQLENVKKQQGYPQVLPILEDIEDIKYFYENGMNSAYVLHQFEIQKSNNLLKSLEKLSVPYEILPCKNEMINAIVASGFPADRFGIEYFPQDLEEILIRRKKAKLTTAIVIKKSELQKTIETISIVYGKDHFIFVQNKQIPFRAQIHGFYDYLKQNPLSQQIQTVKIIVSPFIAEFNENLYEQQNKVRHIFGQAQSQKTNFMDLELLGQKLQKLRKKQTTHQIDIFNMTAEMIQKLKNPQIVKSSLRKMLSLSQNQAEYLFKQGQKRIKIDYLGISEFQNFKRSK